MNGLNLAQIAFVSRNIVEINLLIFLTVITTTISLYMISYELLRNNRYKPNQGDERLNQPSTQDA